VRKEINSDTIQEMEMAMSVMGCRWMGAAEMQKRGLEVVDYLGNRVALAVRARQVCGGVEVEATPCVHTGSGVEEHRGAVSENALLGEAPVIVRFTVWGGRIREKFPT
jgi:hypothetical protein